MIVKNEELLAQFRNSGRCEFCGKICQAREGHHLLPRGMGGGRRLDICINLIALGSTMKFECPCHSRIQGHNERERQCLEIVATREGITCEEIIEVRRMILNLPKKTSRETLLEMGLDKFIDKKPAWSGVILVKTNFPEIPF